MAPTLCGSVTWSRAKTRSLGSAGFRGSMRPIPGIGAVLGVRSRSSRRPSAGKGLGPRTASPGAPRPAGRIVWRSWRVTVLGWAACRSAGRPESFKGESVPCQFGGVRLVASSRRAARADWQRLQTRRGCHRSSVAAPVGPRSRGRIRCLGWPRPTRRPCASASALARGSRVFRLGPGASRGCRRGGGLGAAARIYRESASLGRVGDLWSCVLPLPNPYYVRRAGNREVFSSPSLGETQLFRPRGGTFVIFEVDMPPEIKIFRRSWRAVWTWNSEKLLRGGVPEWLKGTGCKPVGVRLRWFESNPLHQRLRVAKS